ncbi:MULTISPECIES: Na+/H+ antiporter subunit E [unclassified Neptuniibacter]|uniref:Na+/H+ antiporter subunit E n=1 Tax=unclassified Neptuniibacter TaxID=2630693 RepID=UPI000C40652D|nr:MULTISPECIES: Na+/H+ antiporter subunit E [unclassified Neptuniibacter]MAY42459.1 Na+/H+ antiporter subunit E [Oceanospirillaceae bacterium]|tara:strand:- start:4279 stop:4782 length:504 start_codon:yes stop_codon:yes gene_type:complete
MNTKSSFRWLPMPLHSLMLFIIWLLVNNTVAPGHIVLGAFLALTIPLLTSGMQSPQPGFRKPFASMRYMLMVIWDIIIANFEVAQLVIRSSKKLNPAFIAIPLDIQHEFPITILASTVSLTPGTVSAEISEDKKWLYVHVLNLTDKDELITEIKHRYERPLMEIFEC